VLEPSTLQRRYGVFHCVAARINAKNRFVFISHEYSSFYWNVIPAHGALRTPASQYWLRGNYRGMTHHHRRGLVRRCGNKTRCTRISTVLYLACWIVWSRPTNYNLPLVEKQMADSTPRFPFLASAEVATDDSVELTRVTELSRHGCYLETTKHRTAGTRVAVKIINKDQIFEATATVLYSRPTMGMAVAFREVKPLFRSMLKDWLQQSLNQQNQKPSI
jgi:hypothetical protein